MIQTIAAVLLAIHGIIHLIGFVTPWRIATLQGFTYKTTALNGALEVGDSGARLIGTWSGSLLRSASWQPATVSGGASRGRSR